MVVYVGCDYFNLQRFTTKVVTETDKSCQLSDFRDVYIAPTLKSW